MSRQTTKPAARMLAAGVVSLLIAVAGGCELAVPGDVPSFMCTPNYPGDCPSGQSCSSVTHTCVKAGSDDGGGMMDGNEASGDDGDANGMDGDDTVETGDDISRFETGPDGDGIGPCNTTGCACSKNSQCASGLCADKQAVTQNIYNKAGMMTFCTKPCCTSADCDAGTVCFATSAGGNYCVDPSWVGRSAPSGTNNHGGDTCVNDGDCRSGLCDKTGGMCLDTCCSTGSGGSECSAATDCAFSKFPGVGFDTGYTAWCQPPVGNAANGASCTNDPTICRSGLCTCDDQNCFTSHCHDACRNTPDCGSGQSCTYIQLFDNMMNVIGVISACNPKGSGTGTQGMTCSMDTDCATQDCSMANGCTDVCFTDADCGGAWHCLPETVTLKTGGSYEVLDCQP